MTKQAVHTDHAPAAIGPYSQAIVANGFVFCAGQTPIDPATGKLVEGDITVQTEQAIRNVRAVLEAAGTRIEHVVKTTVYLHSMTDFQAMNAVYSKHFTGTPPARTTVGNLNLPLGCLVEIEAIAVLP